MKSSITASIAEPSALDGVWNRAILALKKGNAADPSERQPGLRVGLGISIAAALMILSAARFAQVTTRVSVSSLGAESNNYTISLDISGSGRFVAFASAASTLVSGDTNGTYDIFVHDLQNRTTERVSVSSNEDQANGTCGNPTISADGRFVAFNSLATNLVPGDTNGVGDIFIRDRLNGTASRVSVTTAGAQATARSYQPSLSADGRYVSFSADDSNLVTGDTNGVNDIFLHDNVSGSTERVSVATGGQQANDVSDSSSPSDDGRFVVFYSAASNLVTGDTNFMLDVFVRDRQSGTTERVSVATGGRQANFYSYLPALSGDGRFVVFTSYASNLVSGDTNSTFDVFVRDRQNSTTERVSVSTGGVEANDASGLGVGTGPAISADGRFVLFASIAANLVGSDTNGVYDAFLRDRQAASTEGVSLQGNNDSGTGIGSGLALSGDGLIVAFLSTANNLVANDTNGFVDAFVSQSACTLATAAFRSGGSNPGSYTCNPPILGTTWAATVNLATTGHSFAFLYVFAGQTSVGLLQGQVLLGSGQIARLGPVGGPLAHFSSFVPNDPSLCGTHLTTQALHLGTVTPFAVSNAMDLVVGQ